MSVTDDPEILEAAELLRARKCQVQIIKSNVRCGTVWEWAIEVVGMDTRGNIYDEFWMAVRRAKKEAVALCKERGWPIKKEETK